MGPWAGHGDQWSGLGSRRGQDPRSKAGKRTEVAWWGGSKSRAGGTELEWCAGHPEVGFTQQDVQLRTPAGLRASHTSPCPLEGGGKRYLVLSGFEPRPGAPSPAACFLTTTDPDADIWGSRGRGGPSLKRPCVALAGSAPCWKEPALREEKQVGVTR